jgi:hypothetical protein
VFSGAYSSQGACNTRNLVALTDMSSGNEADSTKTFEPCLCWTVWQIKTGHPNGLLSPIHPGQRWHSGEKWYCWPLWFKTRFSKVPKSTRPEHRDALSLGIGTWERTRGRRDKVNPDMYRRAELSEKLESQHERSFESRLTTYLPGRSD